MSGVEAMGNQFQVNTFTANAQSEPSIGMDDAGNFVIAWAGQGQDLSYFNGIVAQRYDSSGDREGSEIQADTEDTNIHIDPYVASSHDGNFAIAWTSTADPDILIPAPYLATVNVKVFSPTAAVLVPQTSVGGGGSPSLAWDSNDDYTILWDKVADTDNNGTTSGGVYGVEYQLRSPPTARRSSTR